MLNKVLAWSSLAATLLFSGVACLVLWPPEWLRDSQKFVLIGLAVPLLVVAIVLALALLVIAVFRSMFES